MLGGRSCRTGAPIACAAAMARAAGSAWFTVLQTPCWISVSIVTAPALATPAATRRMPPSTKSWISCVCVRNVPRSTARSGMMFDAVPASSMQTDTTAASSGSTVRATIVCRATSNCPAAATGSRAKFGMAAWPAWPRIVNVMRDAAAMTGPACTATVPAARPGQLCRPNTCSIGNRSSMPSASMDRAPPYPSSAGWKMSCTVPVQPASATSSAAAPRRPAVWPSWPHACITPGRVEA